MAPTKYLFTVFIVFAAARGFSQSAPIGWSVSSQQQGNGKYLLKVKAVISTGWYVYAEDDSSNGLTGVLVSLDSDQVCEKPIAKNESLSVSIHDPVFNGKTLLVYRGEAQLSLPLLFRGQVPTHIKVRIQGFAANGNEFRPLDESKDITLEGGVDLIAKSVNRIKLSAIDLNKPAAACGDEQKTSKGILSLFFLGIAGGLIALLTPCVFPMVPVTVSFFTNRARTKRDGVRNGMVYGLFIFGIYVLASLPFHLLGNISPELFNTISTNAWVNIAFFLIFIAFALSFFGLFEITVPSSLVNRTDSKSGLGSTTGIFFMALTLATVSFSCTGPILGSLLVGSLSASGGAWQLTAGMAGFGLALALPFGLFALFPEWLKKLPKSGGWLDTVKKILAFTELALAFKFLSNADLVMHWGILKREVFIGIWILIFAGLTIYLFFVTRRILAVISLFFTLYLLPGLSPTDWSNLKLLSGLAPPLSYSVYSNMEKSDERLHPDLINDFAGALALSRLQHKPILIDFTGWACVNCRKMEEQVWTKPEVARLIREQFILVSLYVDDRKKLPAGERFTYKTKDGQEKEINTVGDRWATFQAENFNQVTQPLYVILDSGARLMNLPQGYQPNADAYAQWLRCGLQAEQATAEK